MSLIEATSAYEQAKVKVQCDNLVADNELLRVVEARQKELEWIKSVVCFFCVFVACECKA